jgi:hypothetical protein
MKQHRDIRVPIALLDRTNRLLELHQRALRLAVTAKPFATERFLVDTDRVRLDLYRPGAADGGVIVQTVTVKGQQPAVDAFYFDDELTSWTTPAAVARTAFPAYCAAYTRLREKRRIALQDAAIATTAAR